MTKLLTFKMAGGFMGIRVSLTVLRDGRFVLIDESTGSKIRGRMDEEQVNRLKLLISKASEYCGEAFEAVTGAADHLTYTLSYNNCLITWVDEPLIDRPLPKPIRELDRTLRETVRSILEDSALRPGHGAF